MSATPELSASEPSIQQKDESDKKQSGNTDLPWHSFVRKASNTEICERFSIDIDSIGKRHQAVFDQYCLIGLADLEGSISDYELDRVYDSIMEDNADNSKNILLFILSRGGSIEPAYQISKICKAHAKEKFVVCIPRRAKSAATLISLGADEIHMGPLGQLGPIDPQLGGLPALGVSQALNSLAALSEKHPASAEMISLYLKSILTVEQIGYCERIVESAVQYAERLLMTKKCLDGKAQAIAKALVNEYKDHGFVIDTEEAISHLGAEWVLTNTPEVMYAEEVYRLFDMVNLFLKVYSKKRLIIAGDIAKGAMVFSL